MAVVSTRTLYDDGYMYCATYNVMPVPCVFCQLLMLFGECVRSEFQ